MSVIYRHYADAEQFAQYIKGKWRGAGTHGRADWPEDTEIDLKIESASFVRLRGVRRKKESGLKRLLARIRGTGEAAFDLSVRGVTDARTEADLAVVTSGIEKITLQAMTEDRCHVTIERTGDRPLLMFSGVVHRK
ncbi:MAG TPA: hypothetical protein PKX74_13985 [Leptospiraceae bacterium]|jgi:hypothetical protein|nr:hypothetical protein [Leptospirales bacterium]HMY46583.1 hypothetical protein [Leptospiraceae bacterium]HNJ35861.1 hypothetical protein [Leptospiraceae bacterium]HNL70737.1 hypothetical protein [Leptospiraceae bacterium]